MQADQQFLEEHPQPIHHRVNRFDRRREQRPRDGDDLGAHRQCLGRVHTGADTARGHQRHVRQRLTHLPQRLCGRDAPLGQRGVADLSVTDELFDTGPRRAARARDVDGSDGTAGQFGCRDGADAVPDLLEHHRVVERPDHIAEPAQRPGEIRVALVLHGLLQRIGVHRDGVGADPSQSSGQPGHHVLRHLRQPHVADHQHVGGHLANREAGRGDVVVDHHSLRPQHHADAQLLRRGGQIAVDDAREFRAAGHRADQDRRSQRAAEEVGA